MQVQLFYKILFKKWESKGSSAWGDQRCEVFWCRLYQPYAESPATVRKKDWEFKRRFCTKDLRQAGGASENILQLSGNSDTRLCIWSNFRAAKELITMDVYILKNLEAKSKVYKKYRHNRNLENLCSFLAILFIFFVIQCPWHCDLQP